mgnify:CR=1 FL=1|tara:strand:- start:329 stop:448 length:120 start_codon:yes stop_codon:yes gene_type:complete
MNYFEALKMLEELHRHLVTGELIELIGYIERNYIAEEEE